MNILFWVLQVLLAFMTLAGGATKAFKYDSIAKQPAMGALPRSAWGAVGILEMVLALSLVVPAWVGLPALTPLGAVALALESLALAALYARSSMKLTAANPLVWVV